MRLIRFRRYLNDDNTIRARFEVERGIVLDFMVQLECHFELSEEWIPIVRYDPAHDFVHYDIVHPYKAATKIEMSTQDYNEALTIALDDFAINWDVHRRRYARWLKQR